MADEGGMSSSTDWMRPPADGSSGPQSPSVDFTRPSIGRVYDYVLGGKNNFAVDRAAADVIIRLLPEAPRLAMENRMALRRAVRYLVAEAGIRQIIDIGSGLPTVGNVHEIAHAIDPQTRVVYVDNDLVVLTHTRALLADNDTTTAITGNLLAPQEIFEDPVTRSHIDQSQPFAVLLAAVLHELSDGQDPVGVVAVIKERLPAGGYLLATNCLDDGDPRAAIMERALLESGLGTVRFRTFEEQLRFLDGLELVEPGLVHANDWRPDEETPKDSPVYNLLAAGLGRKS